MGLVAPFAIGVRAGQALDRGGLGCVTLGATTVPRDGGLMLVVTTLAKVAFE